MVTLTLGIFGELLQRSHQSGTPNVKQPSLKFKPLLDLTDPFLDSKAGGKKMSLLTSPGEISGPN